MRKITLGPEQSYFWLQNIHLRDNLQKRISGGEPCELYSSGGLLLVTLPLPDGPEYHDPNEASLPDHWFSVDAWIQDTKDYVA